MSIRPFSLQLTYFVLWMAVLFLGMGILYWQRGNLLEERMLPKKVMAGMKEYSLEIADTNEERSLGLGRRKELCSSCAMLFLFDTEAKHGFWMAEMRFPIDIVWLQGETVVHIERHVSPESMQSYFPTDVADKVLEANAGSFDTLKVGEKVKFLFSQT